MKIIRNIFILCILALTLGGCTIFEKKDVPMAGQNTDFTITSSAFSDKDFIPLKYAKASGEGGENISIPLKWENEPENTISFALSMVDASPGARDFVHWLVSDIPADITSFPEGASPAGVYGREYRNGYGGLGYGGPFPPPGASHPYEITVYALKDVENLNLSENISLNDFFEAITDHVIAQDTIIGYFSR